MNANDARVVELLTEIRDIQRDLQAKQAEVLASHRVQAELYTAYYADAARRMRYSTISAIVFGVAVFVMIFLFLSHTR